MSKYLEKAEALRSAQDRHYNCAQSVLIPFAEEAGLEEETAYRVAANFGSGMKMGATCGAITGALMALGLHNIADGDALKKILEKMKETHDGCTDCRDLLARSTKLGIPRKTHCDGLVYELISVVEEILEERA